MALEFVDRVRDYWVALMMGQTRPWIILMGSVMILGYCPAALLDQGTGQFWTSVLPASLAGLFIAILAVKAGRLGRVLVIGTIMAFAYSVVWPHFVALVGLLDIAACNHYICYHAFVFIGLIIFGWGLQSYGIKRSR